MQHPTFLQNRYLPGLAILLCCLITGLCIYGDYGVSWDEATQQAIGIANLDYTDAALQQFVDRDHGAAFEIILVAGARLLHLSDTREVILFRHLFCHLFFLAGACFAYLLALRLFRQRWLAAAGMLAFILHPRLYAHSFFNSKDVPFMVALMMALYAIAVAFDKRSIPAFIWAGIACGFATGIRTMGILPIVGTGFFVGIDAARALYLKKGAGRGLLLLAVFLLSAFAALCACWPVLWHQPIARLLESFGNMSHFTRWGGKLLFTGRVYRSTALPWYYAPVWFAISTPLLWLSAGLGGVGFLFVKAVRSPLSFLLDARKRMLLLCAACFVLPLAAVILLHSVLYDDWRHLYFIYAPFVILIVYGLDALARQRRLMIPVKVAAGIQAIVVAGMLIRMHPVQQVYFNALVSHGPERLRYGYDYDYWGISLKQGLEQVLATDPRDSIRIWDWDSPMERNRDILRPAARRRLVYVHEAQESDYILLDYRNHPDDLPYPVAYRLMAGGSTVMVVYKLR